MNQRLLDTFGHLKPGHIYSSHILLHTLNKYNLRGNLSSISYNRWNKGMRLADFNNLLFEWISRGKYKFLGSNYPYTGKVCFFKHDVPYKIIGYWNKGQLSFAHKGIITFADWKKGGYPSDYLGENHYESIMNRMLTVQFYPSSGYGLKISEKDLVINRQNILPSKVIFNINTDDGISVKLTSIKLYNKRGIIRNKSINQFIIDNNFTEGQKINFTFTGMNESVHIYDFV